MEKLQITFRAARINSGLTLKDAGSQCNKSIDTIMKYEKDSSDIPRDLMLTLLELYGVCIDDIFFGKESDFIGKRKQLI